MEKNALAKARKDILRALVAICGNNILPLNISRTVQDGNGCEYGLLDRSVLHPDTLSLFDSHNGPDTNPTEYPIEQMKASDLALILHDAAFAREAAQRAKRQRLEDDMDEIADAIAEEKGQNVPYVASIDLSEFPWVIELLKDPEEMDWNEKNIENIIDTCRFLASNGNKFPKEMKDATFEQFLAYAREHEDEILDEIRKDVENDYKDSVGAEFGTNPRKTSLQEIEREHEQVLKENEKIAFLAIRYLADTNLPFSEARYDRRSDRLTIRMNQYTLGCSPTGAKITDASIHLLCDLGYYTIHYESEKGPFTAAGLFNGNSREEIENAASHYEGNLFYENEPDFLHLILEACDKAGRVPTHIKLTYEETVTAL